MTTGSVGTVLYQVLFFFSIVHAIFWICTIFFSLLATSQKRNVQMGETFRPIGKQILLGFSNAFVNSKGFSAKRLNINLVKTI
jgi:hypothetical protein